MPTRPTSRLSSASRATAARHVAAQPHQRPVRQTTRMCTPSCASRGRPSGLNKLPRYRIETLADNDWVRLTQSQFEPIRDFRRACGSCRPGTLATDPGAINIMLDPGLAFGTGSHPTTRLCLRWLDDTHARRRVRAGLRLRLRHPRHRRTQAGCCNAIGVDVDSQAVQASRDNAAANQVAKCISICRMMHRMQRSFDDLVVANILTNPLACLRRCWRTQRGKAGVSCCPAYLRNRRKT